MARHVSVALTFFMVLAVLHTQGIQARELSFEERVLAQEAIERVYYSHQLGATRRFEEAVPEELLREKVRNYLERSVALEELWGVPVTAESLQREMQRIDENTRFPERVREIRAALGHDPLLVRECVARPALVRRLARRLFDGDREIHRTRRLEAERLRDRLVLDGLDGLTGDPRLKIREITSDALDRVQAETNLLTGEVGPVVEHDGFFDVFVLLDPAERRIAVLTVEKVTWEEWRREIGLEIDETSVSAAAGSTQTRQTDPACIPDGTWDHGILDEVAGQPAPRRGHTATWTGNEMIVWGGSLDLYHVIPTNTGARYDPLLDMWLPMTTSGAPPARDLHTSIWTGDLLVIWGGQEDNSWGLDTGGRYDPLSNSWSPTSLVDAPEGRRGHAAVWTGKEMIVWGGIEFHGDIPWCGEGYADTGSRYDPVTDAWTPMSLSGTPSKRGAHTMVWTGTEAIIWGGFVEVNDYSDPDIPYCRNEALGSGASYDPDSNSWTPISASDAPQERWQHTAVWTGSEMIVWGANYLSNTGGRYDPGFDQWAPTSTIGAPSWHYRHTAVWNGSEMVVWGGAPNWLDTGGRYDPSLDEWTPTPTAGGPEGREEHTAVWTGSAMIVWGGVSASGPLDSGGRLFMGDPDRDGDGVCSDVDNCPEVANPDQADSDADRAGDVCDNCLELSNPGQADADTDGVGNDCDTCPFDPDNDIDGDGICGDADNCAYAFNWTQIDTDEDGVGNICDVCPVQSDPAQLDADGDGAGDACDCQVVDPNDREPDFIHGLTLGFEIAEQAILSWQPSAGADAYSLTRGDLTRLQLGDYGACLAEGIAATSFEDSAEPVPGQVFVYLVQAQSFDCGLGPLGLTSDEVERANANLGACGGHPHTDVRATGEESMYGSVTGDYLDTETSDDVAESITEELTSGNPDNRLSRLEQRWTVPLTAAGRIEFHVEGFCSSSPDGDDFVFEYSTDGGINWNPITLPDLPFSDSGVDLVAALPGWLSGEVILRVIDTNRDPGAQDLDTVSVDELFVRIVP